MLDINGLKYFAILVAWLINMGLGSFWYSPAGFGKQWSKLSGVDIMKLPQNEANLAIGFVAVSALIQAVTLGIIINSLHATSAIDGLLIGLLLWFGLTAATTVGTNFYARKGWNFLWLNASYFLIVMCVNCIILSIWR